MPEQVTITKDDVGAISPAELERSIKYPGLVVRMKELEKEKERILAGTAHLHKQRDELLSRIQPLEAKLREVNQEIAKAERPRLPEIMNEIGALARAMGGRGVGPAAEAMGQ